MSTKTPNIEKHRQLMFDTIQYIYRSPLATKLAFKGGTLCMFLYELERFSVDLDFDLKTGAVNEALTTIEQYISKYGKISDKKKSKILVNYGNGNMPLKIEINSKIQQYDHYETTMFFGTPILAMDKPSMFANKLYTIFQRKERTNKVASRDLFDVWFFFKHHRDINHELLKERSGKTTDQYLNFLLEFIPKYYNKDNLLLGLGQLISPKQKHFVTHHLVEEVSNQIQFYLWNSKK